MGSLFRKFGPYWKGFHFGNPGGFSQYNFYKSPISVLMIDTLWVFASYLCGMTYLAKNDVWYMKCAIGEYNCVWKDLTPSLLLAFLTDLHVVMLLVCSNSSVFKSVLTPFFCF